MLTIHSVLRRYIQEYVSCKTCRSLQTELARGEGRLYFLTVSTLYNQRLSADFSVSKLRFTKSGPGHQGWFQGPSWQEKESTRIGIPIMYFKLSHVCVPWLVHDMMSALNNSSFRLTVEIKSFKNVIMTSIQISTAS
jgi:hypothetical protein